MSIIHIRPCHPAAQLQFGTGLNHRAGYYASILGGGKRFCWVFRTRQESGRVSKTWRGKPQPKNLNRSKLRKQRRKDFVENAQFSEIALQRREGAAQQSRNQKTEPRISRISRMKNFPSRPPSEKDFHRSKRRQRRRNLPSFPSFPSVQEKSVSSVPSVVRSLRD